MALKLIWCQDLKGGIGYQNKLPWNIPAEMDHFRTTTLNHTVVMGRKTYESIGRLLVKRSNIILSSQPNFWIENAIVHQTIEPILTLAQTCDVYVIGGQKTYEAFLAHADELIVSVLNKEYHCDTFMTVDSETFQLDQKIEYENFAVHYYSPKVLESYDLHLSLANFHGSLDLLWTLIRERKYDLHDLDVKSLSEQYLHFVKSQISLIDIDVAAEYLLTAAQLINLKTKWVFSIQDDNHDAINDFLLERNLLVQRLLEYKKIHKGISWLRKKQQERLNKFTKKEYDLIHLNSDQVPENFHLPKQMDLMKLKRGFEMAIAKMKRRQFKKQQLLISELSMEQIEAALKKWMDATLQTQFSFYDYFQSLSSKQQDLKHFVVIFLVILTLVRSGELEFSTKENDIIFTRALGWKNNNEQKQEN